MKTFVIVDTNTNKEIFKTRSNTRLNALRNYKKGLLTSGLYWIEKRNNNYYLVSSFGMNYICYEVK